MNRLVLLAGLFSLALAGCKTATSTPQPTPTTVPTTRPTLPPIATWTPKPVDVSVQVTAELVNCRFGPGTVYETISEVNIGRTLTAVGRNDASTWWYVEDPNIPGGFCWVSADVTVEQGDVAQLPVAEPPFVTVTDVKLRVEPNRIVVNCDQFPQTVFFEAEITTNGPTLFTWKWEASTGAISDVGTLIFEESGTQVINEYYQINAPNDYWVKLYVLTPNARTEQVNFPVSCN